ncbi:MAG: T9SS C-terminal target domain-containing protein [Gracilimonas sp.]|uniref:hypothetical protein n=1 Tax=Gracilimonas sp. TaxID=1974203 RepID=UPI0019963B4A|nr:hypothetical protein [Gracilimonas sp.]MBD3617653.1 T9SS C-terminal target domain-containing protein [Gracilimonas sp.]
MDFKDLLKIFMITALTGSVLVSCSSDNNPVNGNDDDDNTEQHPYASDIRDNGVILPSSIDGNRSLSADSVYYLDGYVFVESGTLTIEPGTVIMGFEEPSEVADGNETALIITRNARIDAEGTAENPIIFTSELDGEPFGETLILNQTNSKLWAGLIILGNAPAYSAGNTDAIQIEGIPDGEARAQYGGDDEEHSSGILKYVSIRFTGAEIGPGDEIQGLTLGGVGRGTTLEYIDIFVSADDGIEIFGGTVDIKYISAAFAEDDAFDFDLGWSGTGQYMFALQGGNGADHGGEWDGASPDNAPLYSTARLYNMTLIGLGQNSTERGADAPAVKMRDGSAYSIYNSIITDFNGLGIEIEDRSESEDSYDKTILDVNGDGASVTGNIWYTGNASSIETMIEVTSGSPRDTDGSTIAAWLNDRDNVFEDPALGGICRTQGCGILDPVPSSAAAASGAATVADANVDQTTYKGAFDPASPAWITGWTSLARYGYLSE